MKHMLETTVDNNAAIASNFNAIASKVQFYINAILGSFAGILALAVIFVGAIAFYKAGKTESEEVRQIQLRRLKWLCIFLIAVAVLWGISPIVTTLMKQFATINT